MKRRWKDVHFWDLSEMHAPAWMESSTLQVMTRPGRKRERVIMYRSGNGRIRETKP